MSVHIADLTGQRWVSGRGVRAFAGTGGPGAGGGFSDAAGTQASPSERVARLPGVNTHWDYTSYKTHAPGGISAIADEIITAGFRHHRDHPETSGATAIDALAAAGCKWIPTLGHAAASAADGTLTAYLNTTRLNFMRDRIADIDLFVGVNEPDNGSLWTSAQIRSTVIACDGLIRGDATLGTRKLMSPCWTFPNNAKVQGVGDISAYVDGSDFHPYPGYQRGEYRNGSGSGVVTERNSAKNLVPGVTHTFAADDWDFADNAYVVTTSETGWHNNYPGGGGTYVPGHHGAPRDVAAAYGPALCVYYDSIGVARLNFYEAINESTSKGGETSSSNQGSFGLMEQDLTWKPLMHAMANFIAIMGDPGAAFTPGLLDYTVSGNSATRHRLYQKRDGTFLLALWQNTSLWTYPSTYTNPANVNVSVTLNRRSADTRTHTPFKIGGSNAGEVTSWLPRSQGVAFTVPCNGWLTIVEIA